MQAFLAAEPSGASPWLQVALAAIPVLGAITVAWISAPWLKEKMTRSSGDPAPKPEQPSALPAPAVAVQPADSLVVRLIEGLQSDLKRARQSERQLIEQRMLDIRQIAQLSAALQDAEQRAEKAYQDMMLSRRMEEDVKHELIELRAKVRVLQTQLAEAGSDY